MLVVFVEWLDVKIIIKVFYLNEVNIKGAEAYRPILKYCEM